MALYWSSWVVCGLFILGLAHLLDEVGFSDRYPFDPGRKGLITLFSVGRSLVRSSQPERIVLSGAFLDRTFSEYRRPNFSHFKLYNFSLSINK